MPHLQPDGMRFVRLFLDDHKLPGTDLVQEALIDVLLHHAAAEFLPQGPQLFVALAGAADAHRRAPARVAGESDHDAITAYGDALVASELASDDFAVRNLQVDLTRLILPECSGARLGHGRDDAVARSEEHTSELQSP